MCRNKSWQQRAAVAVLLLTGGWSAAPRAYCSEADASATDRLTTSKLTHERGHDHVNNNAAANLTTTSTLSTSPRGTGQRGGGQGGNVRAWDGGYSAAKCWFACDASEFVPYCGTDNVTYFNKCEFDSAKCKTADLRSARPWSVPCDGFYDQTDQWLKDWHVELPPGLSTNVPLAESRTTNGGGNNPRPSTWAYKIGDSTSPSPSSQGGDGDSPLVPQVPPMFGAANAPFNLENFAPFHDLSRNRLDFDDVAKLDVGDGRLEDEELDDLHGSATGGTPRSILGMVKSFVDRLLLRLHLSGSHFRTTPRYTTPHYHGNGTQQAGDLHHYRTARYAHSNAGHLPLTGIRNTGSPASLPQRVGGDTDSDVWFGSRDDDDAAHKDFDERIVAIQRRLAEKDSDRHDDVVAGTGNREEHASPRSSSLSKVDVADLFDRDQVFAPPPHPNYDPSLVYPNGSMAAENWAFFQVMPGLPVLLSKSKGSNRESSGSDAEEKRHLAIKVQAMIDKRMRIIPRRIMLPGIAGLASRGCIRLFDSTALSVVTNRVSSASLSSAFKSVGQERRNSTDQFSANSEVEGFSSNSGSTKMEEVVDGLSASSLEHERLFLQADNENQKKRSHPRTCVEAGEDRFREKHEICGGKYVAFNDGEEFLFFQLSEDQLRSVLNYRPEASSFPSDSGESKIAPVDNAQLIYGARGSFEVCFLQNNVPHLRRRAGQIQIHDGSDIDGKAKKVDQRARMRLFLRPGWSAQLDLEAKTASYANLLALKLGDCQGAALEDSSASASPSSLIRHHYDGRISVSYEIGADFRTDPNRIVEWRRRAVATRRAAGERRAKSQLARNRTQELPQRMPPQRTHFLFPPRGGGKRDHVQDDGRRQKHSTPSGVGTGPAIAEMPFPEPSSSQQQRPQPDHGFAYFDSLLVGADDDSNPYIPYDDDDDDDDVNDFFAVLHRDGGGGQPAAFRELLEDSSQIFDDAALLDDWPVGPISPFEDEKRHTARKPKLRRVVNTTPRDELVTFAVCVYGDRNAVGGTLVGRLHIVPDHRDAALLVGLVMFVIMGMPLVWGATLSCYAYQQRQRRKKLRKIRLNQQFDSIERRLWQELGLAVDNEATAGDFETTDDDDAQSSLADEGTTVEPHSNGSTRQGTLSDPQSVNTQLAAEVGVLQDYASRSRRPSVPEVVSSS